MILSVPVRIRHGAGGAVLALTVLLGGCGGSGEVTGAVEATPTEEQAQSSTPTPTRRPTPTARPTTPAAPPTVGPAALGPELQFGAPVTYSIDNRPIVEITVSPPRFAETSPNGRAARGVWVVFDVTLRSVGSPPPGDPFAGRISDINFRLRDASGTAVGSAGNALVAGWGSSLDLLGGSSSTGVLAYDAPSRSGSLVFSAGFPSKVLGHWRF